MSLSVTGLTVGYGGSDVVADLDLEVGSAERFAIMGPSGSGKSTLLRSIAGLIRVNSGTILADGDDITRTPAHRRPVGLMFQDYALFPHMTVADNVAYGLRMAGIATEQRRAKSLELLDLVHLGGFGDRKPATLSGGEQQRVALARTLAPEPSIVLLDEPLGSLDVALRESLLAETRSILTEVGTTSIYVTHDRTEAFAFCDRMAVMHSGGFLQTGTPSDIWNAPDSAFVARAIGQSPLIPRSTFTPGATGTVFVPMDACRMHEGGIYTGVVSASRFRDGIHVASVNVSGAAEPIELRTLEPTAVGSHLRFDVDHEQLIVVSVDQI